MTAAAVRARGLVVGVGMAVSLGWHTWRGRRARRALHRHAAALLRLSERAGREVQRWAS